MSVTTLTPKLVCAPLPLTVSEGFTLIFLSLYIIVASYTTHQVMRSQVKVIAGTRRLEKASHSQAHQHRRRDTNTHCSQALVICSFQNPESSRLRGIDGADPTFPSIRQPSSASKSGSVVCSAAAGFDLGRGSEEAAVPLLGGDDGGNGGDSRGGNGSGKFVDEADDEGGDDDTLLSMQQVLIDANYTSLGGINTREQNHPVIPK